MEQKRFLSLQIMPFEYGISSGLLFGQSQTLSDGGQSMLHSSSGCPPTTFIKRKGIAAKAKICKFLIRLVLKNKLKIMVFDYISRLNET